jgi:hypothetical protein
VSEALRAPFPWFGGKSKVADVAWRAFGDVPNYVEPFAGSLAVLLGRPHAPKTETVNDADCFVSNFWRSVRADPEGVAAHADWPVNECDLHARHWSLVQAAEFREAMRADPDVYDVRLAGWWVWGICQWIGSGWCDVKDAAHRKRPHLAAGGKGIHKLSLNRERGEGRASAESEVAAPHLSTSGMGIHRPSQQLPHLGNAGMGVHRPSQKLPHLGDAGRGCDVVPYMAALSERLRNVRVACGDWSRVTGDSVTWRHGVTAVLLDPPYEDHEGLYAEGTKLSADVRDWAIEYGWRDDMRIALCGYEGEHDMPKEWTVHAWKARGGYASQGDGSNDNCRRERIWFSPACLPLVERQPSLFGVP